MKIQDFVEKYRVRLQMERAMENPNIMSKDMPTGSRHWRCVLRVQRRRLTTPFSQGSGLKDDPTVSDVLDCLAMDAADVEGAKDFEAWAQELGLNTDSRRAENIYRAVMRQTVGLKRLLGDEAFETLLWKTERA